MKYLKKAKIIIVLTLTIIICLNLKINIFAADKISNQSEGIQNIESDDSQKSEALPRAQWVDVPAYQYFLEHYDGSVTYKPIVYKQINVPSGCKIESTGPILIDWIKDSYFDGVKYKQVNKLGWEHKIVKE